MKNKKLQIIFWISLSVFLIWDWSVSKPINILLEPPAISLGSGQKSTGGHCSNSSK